MVIEEIFGDLFEAQNGSYFAHCISSDFALGAGIAKQFVKRKNMREKLLLKYANQDNSELVGTSILIEDTFNLVTKDRYYQKPTYKTIKMSLTDMKNKCVYLGIDTISMPRIGCGLDRLNWDKVKSIIQDVFADTDIRIIVYKFS